MKTILVLRSITLAAMLAGSSLVSSLRASIDLPPISPLQTLSQKVGYADLSLSYSRPLSREREIFGTLVPYGKLWRLGANWATVITVSEDFTVAGHSLPAGSYSLLCIPDEDEWTIIFNRKSEKFWPPAGYEASEDALRFVVKPVTIAQTYQELTFQFLNLAYDRTTLRMNWETTQVEFEMTFNTFEKAEAEITKQLQDPDSMEPEDYNQIATFYHLSGKSLEEALAFYDKAIEKSKQIPFWILFHKAETLVKLDRKTEAIKVAEQAIEASKRDAVWGPKYADWGNKLIDRIK